MGTGAGLRLCQLGRIGSEWCGLLGGGVAGCKRSGEGSWH